MLLWSNGDFVTGMIYDCVKTIEKELDRRKLSYTRTFGV